MAIAYFLHLRRLDGSDRGRHAASFSSGLLVLWAALDWPLGPLGASYLASVHVLQFLLIALVAPPLLLAGLPRATFAALQRRPLERSLDPSAHHHNALCEVSSVRPV